MLCLPHAEVFFKYLLTNNTITLVRLIHILKALRIVQKSVCLPSWRGKHSKKYQKHLNCTLFIQNTINYVWQQCTAIWSGIFKNLLFRRHFSAVLESYHWLNDDEKSAKKNCQPIGIKETHPVYCSPFLHVYLTFCTHCLEAPWLLFLIQF